MILEVEDNYENLRVEENKLYMSFKDIYIESHYVNNVVIASISFSKRDRKRM